MAEVAIIIVPVVIVIVIAYRFLTRRGKQMALLISRGAEATGKVISARRVRRSRTHETFKVRYAFVTSGGVEQEREIEVRPQDFEQFSEGQTIEIVYDHANPKVNMLKSAVSEARKAMNSRHSF